MNDDVTGERTQRQLGIKLLDDENWLEPDEAARVFAYVTAKGKARSMGDGDWARVFLAPQLSTECPKELLVAFETARGALLYGYYFYPLYALGQRELLHVAEMALRVRCEQLGLPKRRTKTFTQRVEALRDAEEVTGEEAESWTRLRSIRNSLVHTSTATIVMPGDAARILNRIAALTNAMYSERHA